MGVAASGFDGGLRCHDAYVLEEEGWIMPVYLYECRDCGKFEAYRTIEERGRAQCPTCKKRARKLPFASTIEITPEFKAEWYYPFGKFIGSRYERSEEMKRTGAWEPGDLTPKENPKPSLVDACGGDFCEQVIAAKKRGELRSNGG